MNITMRRLNLHVSTAWRCAATESIDQTLINKRDILFCQRGRGRRAYLMCSRLTGPVAGIKIIRSYLLRFQIAACFAYDY